MRAIAGPAAARTPLQGKTAGRLPPPAPCAGVLCRRLARLVEVLQGMNPLIQWPSGRPLGRAAADALELRNSQGTEACRRRRKTLRGAGTGESDVWGSIHWFVFGSVRISCAVPLFH